MTEMSNSRQMSLLAARLPMSADFVTPKELAAASGFSVQFILDSLDSGKVFGLQANGRAAKGSEVRRHTRIPREAAILWLAEHATFSDEDFILNLLELIDRLPLAMRRQLYTHIGRKLQ